MLGQIAENWSSSVPTRQVIGQLVPQRICPDFLTTDDATQNLIRELKQAKKTALYAPRQVSSYKGLIQEFLKPEAKFSAIEFAARANKLIKLLGKYADKRHWTGETTYDKQDFVLMVRDEYQRQLKEEWGIDSDPEFAKMKQNGYKINPQIAVSGILDPEYKHDSLNALKDFDFRKDRLFVCRDEYKPSVLWE